LISVAETIAVPSPPERVWEVVSEPAEVVACINGAELLRANEDGSYDGALVVRFGGLRVKFGARVALALDPALREGRLTATGRDGQQATRFRGDARFQVLPDGDGSGSRVVLDGEVQLNGKLAGLVESGSAAVVSRMTREFSAQLVQRCAAPVAAAQVEAQIAGAGAGAGSGDEVAAGRRGGVRAWWARVWTWLRGGNRRAVGDTGTGTGAGAGVGGRS
jgi:carbon monoxide dehydrogenase subunit G